MKMHFKLLTLSTGLLIGLSAFAQVPADAPAGTTGLCKDGTYYSGATKQGACRGHKGVKDWYAAATTAAPAALGPATAPTAAAPVSPPPAAPVAKPAPSTKSNFTPPAVAAAGGGPGMVWANKKSKVYHCSTDKWYGKTKDGQYLSEADAKAQGFKPDHGKACQ
jgi:hypothetical protein